MEFIAYLLQLLIFVWGTLCLNGFREAFRYNTLGEYTEINVDVNTLLGISVVNSLMMITNYKKIIFLIIVNNLAMMILALFNILNYQSCINLCYEFYTDNRFYYYLTFINILPYIQFIICLISVSSLSQNYLKSRFCIKVDNNNIENNNLISDEVE